MKPGDFVILPHRRSIRAWRITGVYLGGVGQESVVGLEVADGRSNSHVGEDEVIEMFVPLALVEDKVFAHLGNTDAE